VLLILDFKPPIHPPLVGAMNFQAYTELIHILTQAEKHDELLLKNHHKFPTGAKPLPEVHHNVQNTNKFNGHPRHSKDFKGKRKFPKKKKYNAKNQGNDNSKPKFDKSKTCYKSGELSYSKALSRPISQVYGS